MTINRRIQKILTPLWKNLYDNVSNCFHLFTTSVNSVLEFPTGDKKNLIFL